MPFMPAAWSCQDWLPFIDAKTPYPMMPAAIRMTTPATAIGPQLRPPLTLTGAIGLRPFGPFPAAPLPPPGRAPVAFADLDGPAGGLPWPDFLPTRTVDGTRSGPGVLMLIVPRQFKRSRKGGARVATERQSLPPITWLSDSRQPRRHCSRRRPGRVRRSRARRLHPARGDDRG